MDKKKMIRWAAICLSSFVAVVVIVPSILVKSPPSPSPSSLQPASDSRQSETAGQPALQIPVYMSKQQKVVQLPLDQYVRGVLAAEMPIEFELEAMKAQAMAARTYIIRRMIEQDTSNVPVSGAWVTDTVAHQAYISDEELKAKWGEVYAANSDKLNRAVDETRDLILTYDGKPIQATFFSTSNGYTENSEDYWNEYIPYLRSVPSPWDMKLSPRYKETVTVSYKELQRKLGTPGIVPVSTNSRSGMKIMEMTKGHRVKRVVIAGKSFTGREVRERLGLNSSHFEWSWKGTDLLITTFGYGHGVGMSQWGANGMAQQGRKADEIVKYFYTGIGIDRASKLVKGKSF
ncbi:stage II sporulation protein D [Paenibacillus piri]|uniref:Stage II sporulation protein D n=1 Tax=Paenibacillus piri TaxID=2547395 RepID=A0A4R5KE63_9BACL|nr:stage II sporulation protein D [Paenibacillus piri]TDF93533.1 stage II sporulation protein D [Paenibacillus piri]